ncbi:helix-turn-helix domain-containing protein [Streptomyces sp. NPDC002769]|uniref:PucR family transcriptional regulator n=1 Tax=Streptomyces sp. NPDC002769 TaxID=3154542 RepID=UPI00332F5217
MSSGPRSGDGNGAVAELCRAVLMDLPALVPGVVERIRQEVPGYDVIDRDDHERGVIEGYRGLLAGLIARQPPSQTESEHAYVLGRRRAAQGLPLGSLIGAYHVGHREMWNILLMRVGAQDHEMRSQLVGLVATVWNWVEQATRAAADAYSESIRAEVAMQLGLTHQLLDMLASGSPVAMEGAHVARALGFDPGGAFQALCSSGEAVSDEDTAALRDRFRRRRGTMQCAVRGTVVIALVQDMPVDVLVAAMHELDPRVSVGVGLARSGLDGAAASIRDAQDVLPSGTDGRVGRFERDWLLAVTHPQAARLAALLEPCRSVAASHPQLAETVEGFAHHGLSLNAAGQALHVHANTVRYRLDRWQELTGCDARTWAGLSASMVGIALWDT